MGGLHFLASLGLGGNMGLVLASEVWEETSITSGSENFIARSLCHSNSNFFDVGLDKDVWSNVFSQPTVDIEYEHEVGLTVIDWDLGF